MKYLRLSSIERAVTLITLTTARANGYMGDMRNLTRAQALKILEADYWYGPRFDQVAIISHSVAAEYCDTGVNMGPFIPIEWFQRWLNVFNDQQRFYPDLIVDGQIGPRNLSALKIFLSSQKSEGEMILIRALNCSQRQRYLELAEQRQANELFTYG